MNGLLIGFKMRRPKNTSSVVTCKSFARLKREYLVYVVDKILDSKDFVDLETFYRESRRYKEIKKVTSFERYLNTKSRKTLKEQPYDI